MNEYKVLRDMAGLLLEECPVNVGVKIGSFDCTKNCENNQNTRKEITDFGFETPVIRCSEMPKLIKQEQLTFNI